MTEHTESAKIEPTTPDSQDQRPKPLPDIADMIFVFILLLLINMLPNFVLGDGSTGWHLATGQYILQHGQIPHTDLFSNTFPNKEWVPYEWLADVVGAFLVQLGGIKMVAVATACAIAWLFALIYLECRRNGCHFFIAMILTILGTLASSIHWLARPHIFTFYGVFIFSTQLERFRRGEESARKTLIVLGLAMTIWANAHPAFLVGLALVIIYTVAELVSYLSSAEAFRAASLNRLKTFAMACGVAFGATLINPNAGHMYTYIFAYLRHSVVLAQTNEYMPPDFKQLHAICMALIFFFFVIGLAITKRKTGLAPILTAMAFAWLAINSMRNEPLFCIIAVPITAGLFATMAPERLLGAGFEPAGWLNNGIKKLQNFSANIDEVERTCTMHILPLVATGILAISCLMNGRIGPLELVTSDFDIATKPSDTLAYIESNKLDWRHGLNLDNWGGYIFYKTGKRVFIDDRLDFYGGDFFMDYGKIINAHPDYKTLLAKHQIEWVLFPKNSGLVRTLVDSGNWKKVCEDKAAALLIRTNGRQI